MRKLIFTNVILFVFFSLFLNQDVFSWDNEVTHRDLSKYAADNSSLSKNKGDYLRNLGFNLGLDEVWVWQGKKWTVTKWLQEGADLEDASSFLFPLFGTTRSFNHFHNPLKPWAQAGLDDFWTGESSLLWAQDGVYQQNFPKGDWSWQKIREYYYLALTSKTETDRQANFAKTFRGLGHQMHLIQDAAQPDHVRNDAHPEDAIFGKNILNGSRYFETWAKEEWRLINSFAANPIFPAISFNVSYNGFVPITQLFDTDQYNGTNPTTSLTQGISEYTNANFFSGDTIFAAERYAPDHRHYFPYPGRSSTDLQSFIDGTKPPEPITEADGETDTGIWISKLSDGETVSHLVRTSSLTKTVYNLFGEGDLFYSTLYRDEKCHEDYAQKLIPRAVGYSAALLDYFFRGTIEITLPDRGIYSLTDDPDIGFTRITLLAKNTTSNGEEMTDGSIELIVKYRINPEETDYHTIVVSEERETPSISRDIPTELTFDLSAQPIPVNATDLHIRILYRGKLGLEEGAVAIGYKDISEPTPIDIFNNMDRICLYGTWYDAGSPEAISQVDMNQDGVADLSEWDVYAHDIGDIFIKFSSENNPEYASPTEYDYVVANLPAGGFIRPLYILTDYQFNYSIYVSYRTTNPEDQWMHLPKTTLYIGTGIKNQTEYTEDEAICGGKEKTPCYNTITPEICTFRGIDMWWGGGAIYIIRGYPPEMNCFSGNETTCTITLIE